eukprot:symbB.v1.2.027717.t1/scaffold2861.1/size68641/7
MEPAFEHVDFTDLQELLEGLQNGGEQDFCRGMSYTNYAMVKWPDLSAAVSSMVVSQNGCFHFTSITAEVPENRKMIWGYLEKKDET